MHPATVSSGGAAFWIADRAGKRLTNNNALSLNASFASTLQRVRECFHAWQSLQPSLNKKVDKGWEQGQNN